MSEPVFRAGWTKHAIQAINKSRYREPLRRLIGELALAEVRQSSMLDWLPLPVHLSVVEAVYGVLGIGGARDFWRERLLASFDTKLMAPIAHGSTFMFGARLYGCMKMAVYSYRLVARDAGIIAVEQKEGGPVVMTFSVVPAALVRSAGWQALCHGQCQAVAEYAGHLNADISVGDVTTAGYVYSIHP